EDDGVRPLAPGQHVLPVEGAGTARAAQVGDEALVALAQAGEGLEAGELVHAPASLGAGGASGERKPSARYVITSVSRQPGPSPSGWIGVVSWITFASSISSALQGSVTVKRRPRGPWASNTRDSPPRMFWRPTIRTATKWTPSRCAPSGVGRPMPPVVSIRNWCASTRSEERRVGKECRAPGSQNNCKKKEQKRVRQ